MEIIAAKTAGFCFGVSRAVKMAYDAAGSGGERGVYSLGPIIHNEQVVSDLQAKGVRIVKEPEDIPGATVVIIESHGVGKDIIARIPKDCTIIDATCPYVDKIHRIVNEYHDKGYTIVIVGNASHPEVVGINGWCGGSAVIVGSADETDMIPEKQPGICVVSQTTNESTVWKEIKDKIKSRFPDAVIFDTICTATGDRQKEAGEIAKNVDAMVVVGSKKSANTKNLYNICSRICPNTLYVETPDEIEYNILAGSKKVGVTAGASTPEWVIKEVIDRMNCAGTTEKDQNFGEMFEDSLVSLNSGDVVKGTVIGVRNSEVYVNIGYKSDGIIPAGEYSSDPNFNVEDEVKEGEEIEALVVKVNDAEGNVVLSRRRVELVNGLMLMEKAFESGDILTGKIVDVVNGGVIAVSNGVRVFIPGSQLSDRFVKNFEEFRNTTVSFRVIDFDRNKNRIVGSSRVVLEEQKKSRTEDIWGSIEVGKRYRGTVKGITDFGAFVDIGGIDGLVHIGEMSWKKIKHPSEILKIGDVVDVDIINFDRERGRVSLSMKSTTENPWSKAVEKYKVGDVIKGKVTRLVPFGAFLELEPGVDALVHISQISYRRLSRPADVLSMGQEVEAKIMEIDEQKQKISASIKEVAPIDTKNDPRSEG